MASKERNDQGAQTMEGSRERESHSLSHSYGKDCDDSDKRSPTVWKSVLVGKRQVGNK